MCIALIEKLWKRAKATKLTLSGDGNKVTGKLVRSSNMEVIAGAQVVVKVTDPSGDVTQNTVMTDANGAFNAQFDASEVGNYTVDAHYAGEENKWLACDATPLVVQVNYPPAKPTTLTLTASPQAATVGQTVTITCTLKG